MPSAIAQPKRFSQNASLQTLRIRHSFESNYQVTVHRFPLGPPACCRYLNLFLTAITLRSSSLSAVNSELALLSFPTAFTAHYSDIAVPDIAARSGYWILVAQNSG